jgi:hypothetical protein
MTFLKTYVVARKAAEQTKFKKCGRRVNAGVMTRHALHSMLILR